MPAKPGGPMASFFARTRRGPSTPVRMLFVCVALAPAIAQLACFVYALAARAAYPMDLEWLEGTQLYEAVRFARGLPVYGPPAQGFVPSPYPPLYHLVVSFVGRCFGFDYWSGRIVSDVAIAVALAVQTAVLLRAAPSARVGRVLAVLGAGAVAASYRPLQASMDLARVDMLGFAIVAVAAWTSRARAFGPVRTALLGVLLCAGVYTKQTNVFYALWIIASLARRRPRQAALAAGLAAALGAASLVYLQEVSGGWFWTWMTTMRHHGLVAARCVFWAAIVLAVGAALGSVLAAFRRRGWLRDATLFWCGMLGASVPACVLPMLSGGGWVNNLIGLTLLALLVALLLVCDAVRALPGPSAARWIVAVLSALLLGALYDPNANVPDAARRRDVDTLHAAVRSLQGDVLTPMYPFVAVRDGKANPQMSLVACDDTVHPGDVNADPSAPLRSTHAEWIVLFGHAQEDDVPAWLGPRYVPHPLPLRVQA
ncbi:MAG TPA: hypothetical protein VIY73_01215, partial [Polyangiaceae bacterium]